MELVHIADGPDDTILVTYLFHRSEFEAIQAEALAKGELNEDNISGDSVQLPLEDTNCGNDDHGNTKSESD